MKAPLLAILTATLFLSACDSVRNSRANPFNWFSRSTEETLAVTAPEGGVYDDRAMVSQVTALKADKAPGGAIITAVGLPPYQGYWAAELIAENNGAPVNGVLSFQFRVYPPAVAAPQGTPLSRELSAGIFVSDQSLDGVKTITVKGGQNQRSVRR